MIAFFGWIGLAGGGAFLAFAIGVVLVFALGRGALEIVPAALICGAVFAAAWLIFVFWLSPVTISVSGACT